MSRRRRRRVPAAGRVPAARPGPAVRRACRRGDSRRPRSGGSPGGSRPWAPRFSAPPRSPPPSSSPCCTATRPRSAPPRTRAAQGAARRERPAGLSGPVGARRLPDDRPHRRLGEHDGDDGLAANRRLPSASSSSSPPTPAAPGGWPRSGCPAAASRRSATRPTRIAGGPRGWMAEGDNAIWTSPDGQTWTLAGTHGITPRERGDVVNVVTARPAGSWPPVTTGPAPSSRP